MLIVFSLYGCVVCVVFVFVVVCAALCCVVLYGVVALCLCMLFVVFTLPSSLNANGRMRAIIFTNRQIELSGSGVAALVGHFRPKEMKSSRYESNSRKQIFTERI